MVSLNLSVSNAGSTSPASGHDADGDSVPPAGQRIVPQVETSPAIKGKEGKGSHQRNAKKQKAERHERHRPAVISVTVVGGGKGMAL